MTEIIVSIVCAFVVGVLAGMVGLILILSLLMAAAKERRRPGYIEDGGRHLRSVK